MDRGFTAIVAKLDAAGRPTRRPTARTARPTRPACCGWPARPSSAPSAARPGPSTGPPSSGPPAPSPSGRSSSAGRRWLPPSRRRSAGIAGLGKATVGEKTMLDALTPALDAARPPSPPEATVTACWPRPPMPQQPGRRRPSRCSRPRVGRRTSASGASATRIPARPRRRCCCGPSPTSPEPADRGPLHRADRPQPLRPPRSPGCDVRPGGGGFRSSITIQNASRNGTVVDAKSILGVLGLGVSPGHRIAVTVDRRGRGRRDHCADRAGRVRDRRGGGLTVRLSGVAAAPGAAVGPAWIYRAPSRLNGAGSPSIGLDEAASIAADRLENVAAGVRGRAVPTTRRSSRPRA